MNITISVDERVAEQARRTAQNMGKSLNQVVRDYLEHLAGAEATEVKVQAFERSAQQSPGRLKGWHFDREDANDGN